MFQCVNIAHGKIARSSACISSTNFGSSKPRWPPSVYSNCPSTSMAHHMRGFLSHNEERLLLAGWDSVSLLSRLSLGNCIGQCLVEQCQLNETVSGAIRDTWQDWGQVQGKCQSCCCIGSSTIPELIKSNSPIAWFKISENIFDFNSWSIDFLTLGWDKLM